MKKPDYSQITETPGDRVTRDQLVRYYQRYFFASQYSRGKDVLEVACGGGGGLGLLADTARSVVAIDCEPKNVTLAAATYADTPKVRILAGDALNLDFPDRSFDVVILFEAIYYLPDPARFLAECRRVLRPGGRLIIGSANKEWKDFNPSAYSTRYFSASDLKDLMEGHGFETSLLKGFPVSDRPSAVHTILSQVKRIAVKARLIPKSMKYKKLLKRIFVGRLVDLPLRIREGAVDYLPPGPIDPADPDRQFKVIYALGRLREA